MIQRHFNSWKIRSLGAISVSAKICRSSNAPQVSLCTLPKVEFGEPCFPAAIPCCSLCASTPSPLNLTRWRLSDLTTPQDDPDKFIHSFLAIAWPQGTGLLLELSHGSQTKHDMEEAVRARRELPPAGLRVGFIPPHSNHPKAHTHRPASSNQTKKVHIPRQGLTKAE